MATEFTTLGVHRKTHDRFNALNTQNMSQNAFLVELMDAYEDKLTPHESGEPTSDSADLREINEQLDDILEAVRTPSVNEQLDIDSLVDEIVSELSHDSEREFEMDDSTAETIVREITGRIDDLQADMGRLPNKVASELKSGY